MGEHRHKKKTQAQAANPTAWKERPMPEHMVQKAVDDVKLLHKAFANTVGYRSCAVGGGSGMVSMAWANRW